MREPCYKCKFEHKPIDQEPCEHCSDEYIESGDHPAFQWAKSSTNYDIIHSMNTEELAKLFAGWIQDCDCNSVPCKDRCKKDRDSDEVKPCTYYWLEWLRQESKNEA
jgi:hypothetical protein